MGLQQDLSAAIAQVSQLHELTVQLEGRLEEDHTAHEEAVAGRDEEIDLLNQRVRYDVIQRSPVCCYEFSLQLTQLETKLIKLSRGLPFDPSRKDFTPLADKVYEAIAQVREYACVLRLYHHYDVIMGRCGRLYLMTLMC